MSAYTQGYAQGHDQPFLQQQAQIVETKQPACSWCSSGRLRVSALLLSVFGLVLLLVATFVPPYIHDKLDSGIRDFVSLAPSALEKGSDGFKAWSDWSDENAVPVYQSFYIFNFSNPTDILEGKVAHVTQHGPYVYREYKVKFDFSYTEDEDNRELIQFKERIYWEYQPDLSGAGLDPDRDNYTTFNVPFQAVSYGVQATGFTGLVLPTWVEECSVDGYAESDEAKLFTNKHSVSDLLFGYNDCIGAHIPARGLSAGGFPGLLGPNYTPAQKSNEQIAHNLTYDQVYTGSDVESMMRQYYSVKEQIYLNYTLPTAPTDFKPIWGSAVANRIHGTDGTQFQRDVQEGSTAVVYVDELSRSAPLVNLDKIHVKDLHELDLLRFRLDPKLLLNATQVPSNAAYYMYDINGLIPINNTQSGLPIYMSKPHFLHADPWLIQQVEGMKPQEVLHDTSVDVEPITGATMRAQKRLQINLQVQPFTYKDIFGKEYNYYPKVAGNFSARYMPVGWLDEHAEISASKASTFRKEVYGARAVMKYLAVLGAIAAAILLAVANAFFFMATSRAAKEGAANAYGGMYVNH